MKNRRLTIFLLMGVILILNTTGCFSKVRQVETVDAQSLGDGLFSRIKTDKGEIIVRLEYQRAPLTVCNFVGLAEGKMDAARGMGYYNGLNFHRVISKANGDSQDFMIQGGCPQGNGRGGPGYQFPDEIDPGLKHDRPGVLSMANAGPGTNGSQFFITIVPTPHLDGKHTVFGYVVQGQNIVNTIKQGEIIQSITIARNGTEASSFVADQANFDRLLSEVRGAEERKKQNGRQTELAKINSLYPDTQQSASGIRYVIEKQGTGNKPVRGKEVSVHYTGMLLDGTVFDDSRVRGSPIEFDVGTGRVIKGWDEMVMDMKVGEKRTVIIPPELGYGERGAGGVIPPNAFLIFEMELVSFK